MLNQWVNLYNTPKSYKVSGVYCIRCKITGKEYVGQSADVYKRLRTHLKLKHSTTYIHRAIRVHGIESFEVTLLASGLTFSELCSMEKLKIAERNTKAPNGYNLTEGGEGASGYRHTSETKAMFREQHLGRKLSDSHRLNIGLGGLGKVITQSTRLKIARANLGKVRTQESRIKMQKSALGKVLSESTRQKLRNASTGREHSDETKAKLSALALGRPRPELVGGVPGNAKEVALWLYDSLTPLYFNCVKFAAIETGLSYDVLRNTLSGKTNIPRNFSIHYT